MQSGTSLSNMKSIEQSSFKQKNPVKQGSMCSDKNCQENRSINMQPVKPSIDMWLPKPAVPYQYKGCIVTRTVNLQGVTRNLNTLNVTRTVNLCSQRSQ